jgi:hypothetical protein
MHTSAEPTGESASYDVRQLRGEGLLRYVIPALVSQVEYCPLLRPMSDAAEQETADLVLLGLRNSPRNPP